MEYNSFYGGRKGSSFVLAKSFSSMEEMIAEFKKGNSYTTVAYDEYVLIDADNKSNPDNGKIFKRGYDSVNELGGAIYIGQIVGPPGPPPHFELKTVEEVENIKIQNPDSIEGTGVYAPGDNLIPGKYEDAQGNVKYNDEIKWSYCSVMDSNKNEIIAHVGFVFPYPVFEYEYELVDAYQSTNLMTRLDDKKHPFYEKWKLSIPKGVKGDGIKNFRLIEATNSIQDYTGKTDDVTNKRKVLVYDYYDYENNATGEPKTLYLGDYNMIDNITLNDEGTFTIDYSHNDTVTYNKLFKWIKSATLDGISGKFTIEYNQATDANGTATKYETYLKYIKDVNITDEGSVVFTYTTGETENFDKYIKTIKQVTLDSNTGLLTVDYNQEKDKDGNSTQYTANLTWVKDVNVDEEGTITFNYTTGEQEIYSKYIKTIKNIELNSNTGQLVVNYNQTTDKDGNPTQYTTNLSWINSVKVSEDGTLTFGYTTGEETSFDKYIKTIKQVALNPENGHLIVDYNQATDVNGNATQYTTDLTWVKNVNITEDGTITFSYTTGEEVTFDKYIKTIKNVELNSNTGHLTINYNQTTDKDGKSTQYNADLTWVKDIQIDDEGSVTLIYTTGNNKVYSKLIKTVDSITLDADTGEFQVVYNQDSDENGDATLYKTNLRWVKNVSIDEEGTINFDYTNGTDTTYSKYIKTVKNIELDNETGQFTVTYNHLLDANGNSTTYQTNLSWIKGMTLTEDGSVILQRSSGSDITLDNKIKWIKDAQINTGLIEGSGNQKLKITYNDNTFKEIGNPINYIMKTAFSEDFHFLVLYSDPARREAIVAAGENAIYDGRNDWHDLGSIKDDDGVLIGKNLSSTSNPQLATIDGALSYLNETYPNGLSGESLTGKIITVGADKDSKLFYAFDYSKDTNGQYMGWYYLGSLQTGGSAVAGKASDSLTQSLVDQLPSYGIWFIVEE